ncbi:MAG: hypothetical protein H6740_09585 [Alphaproteobacteria bacterium]|nr:hypothetical protein [Alphaproteobacteria bacterium]
MTFLLIALAPLAHAQSSCRGAWSVAELENTLDSAEAAFKDLEVEAFGEAIDDVVLQLPCLTEPVSPALASRTHALIGLRQYTAGEESRAAQAFAAARRADPSAELLAGLLPEGHEVYELTVSLPLENVELVEIYPASEGELRFDGRASLQRPDSWPTLMQHVVEGEPVRDTVYLYPGEALPDYGALIPDPPPIAALPFIRTKAQLGFAGGALAGGLAAGGMLLAARSTGAVFDGERSTSIQVDSLPGQRALTNGLTVGAGVAGGLAVGAGAMAVVSGRW